MYDRRFPTRNESTTSGSVTAGPGPSGAVQSSGGSESEEGSGSEEESESAEKSEDGEESEGGEESDGDTGTLQGDRPPFVPPSPASVADAMGG